MHQRTWGWLLLLEILSQPHLVRKWGNLVETLQWPPCTYRPMARGLIILFVVWVTDKSLLNGLGKLQKHVLTSWLLISQRSHTFYTPVNPVLFHFAQLLLKAPLTDLIMLNGMLCVWFSAPPPLEKKSELFWSFFKLHRVLFVPICPDLSLKRMLLGHSWWITLFLFLRLLKLLWSKVPAWFINSTPLNSFRRLF